MWLIVFYVSQVGCSPKFRNKKRNKTLLTWAAASRSWHLHHQSSEKNNQMCFSLFFILVLGGSHDLLTVHLILLISCGLTQLQTALRGVGEAHKLGTLGLEGVLYTVSCMPKSWPTTKGVNNQNFTEVIKIWCFLNTSTHAVNQFSRNKTQDYE